METNRYSPIAVDLLCQSPLKDDVSRLHLGGLAVSSERMTGAVFLFQVLMVG